MFQAKIVEKIKTHTLCSVTFFFENPAVNEIMWKNIVERSRPRMTIWRMHIACWIPKATDTYSEYIMLIAFSRQKWFRESVWMFRYTCIVCSVIFIIFSSTPAFWKWRLSSRFPHQNFVWLSPHPHPQVYYISCPAYYVAFMSICIS